MKSGRRHRLRRNLIALGVIVAVFLTLTAVLFVFPSTDAPRRSNAIVVLGGFRAPSIKGARSTRAGYAPVSRRLRHHPRRHALHRHTR